MLSSRKEKNGMQFSSARNLYRWFGDFVDLVHFRVRQLFGRLAAVEFVQPKSPSNGIQNSHFSRLAQVILFDRVGLRRLSLLLLQPALERAGHRIRLRFPPVFRATTRRT